MMSPRPLIPILAALLAVLLACLAANAAHAGVVRVLDPDPGPRELEAQGRTAMEAGDYDKAQTIYERLRDAVPTSFVPLYNLACARSRLGDEAGAVDALGRAVVMGFTDRLALATDPDLAALRRTDFYADLLDRWPEIVSARRRADTERATEMLRVKDERRTLADLRLEIISGHDSVSTDQAVDELETIAEWAHGEVFRGLARTPGDDHAWVMIVLPGKTGFARWAIETFGRGAIGSISSVGGAYEHQQRRLVARDLGATLRHEFVHVLHWRDMTRLGQEHAAWIQEGLASLVEDTDPGPGGRLILAPSWRTNMVKRMKEVGVLPEIRELAGQGMRSFTARRPLAKYAHARTVLMFLEDQGLLSAFYTTYTERFDEDPTGLAALGRVTGMEPDQLEDAYREWIDALPVVPETGSDLDATIGLAVAEGSGDGVVVREVPHDLRRESGIRIGSVLTAIDGRPTRDLHEFIRVLATRNPGQTVTIHHRWGRVHAEARVTLEPR